MNPALFYDNMTCDEAGIRLAAEKKGINLEIVNFPTTVNMLESFIQNSPVVNRCQSKARRERASFIVEERGGHVINAFGTEVVCNSKIFTISRFTKAGVRTVKTAYIPFAVDREGERTLYRMDDVNIVIEKVESLFKYPFVAKPERGSRGRNIIKVERKEQFESLLKKWVRSLDSPAGLIAQECLSKAFDLRIVVSSYDGEKYTCLASLARVPSSKEDFVTNTALGAIPVGVELPKKAREEVVRATTAVSREVGVLGIDVIPSLTNEAFEKVVEHAEKIAPIHKRVKRFKEAFSNSVKLPLEKFLRAKENLDNSFREMMNTLEYARLKNLLEELLEDAELYFIEVNSRPDFYVNTRNCTGVDVSEAYVRCVEALL